jgi:adenosylcobinamide kinase/adenosylcobinamide-phosphate guanylyltransferase
MAKIILITGGSRSGKSRYALQLGQSLEGKRAFIATCPPVDEEMQARITRHKQTRDSAKWQTIEETAELEKVITSRPGYEVYLIDCLTLWINNLMYEGLEKNVTYTEDMIEQKCLDLLQAMNSSNANFIIVTNEVGMSVIPAEPETRLYRDLIGRANQVLAAKADEFVLVTCGIPMKVKG